MCFLLLHFIRNLNLKPNLLPWNTHLEQVDPEKSFETFPKKALRRRWEAALEERDALQIQMNNMEKDLEGYLNSVRNPHKLLFFFGKFWLTSTNWRGERSFKRLLVKVGWKKDRRWSVLQKIYSLPGNDATVFDEIWIDSDRYSSFQKWTTESDHRFYHSPPQSTSFGGVNV